MRSRARWRAGSPFARSSPTPTAAARRTLRKLELRLLEQGVSVSRTADDLVRYHGKMIIIDNRVLHVYGFNFTGLDIERSRSFG